MTLPRDSQPDANALPSMVIVTPNFNLAPFLETTMRSVLDQEYPRLEYVVVDGGSTDGSVDLIRHYADRLTWWASEPDQGHFDAINKGFAHTTGEIMGWLNSDDVYLPWTLATVGAIFQQHPDVEWITSLHHLHLNDAGRAIACGYQPGYNRATFLRGANLVDGRGYARGWIQQESTFWRRSLWDRAGGRVERSGRIAADFDLWARFFRSAELHGVATPLAGFRRRDGQFSAQPLDAYWDMAGQTLAREGGRRYGRCSAGLRRTLQACLGCRPLARQLPPALTRALVGLRLLSPVKNIAWRDGRWTIENDYVV